MPDAMTSRPRWRTVLVILLAVPVLTVIATRRNRTLAVGQTAHFDDFFFTVESASRSPDDPKHGDAPSARPPSAGAEYVVRMRVDNRAKRVPFTFRGDGFALVDPEGRHAPVRPRAERAASGERVAPMSHTLQAGESLAVDYVFEPPADPARFRLRIMPGGALGDFLDWLLSGRQEFRLP